MKGEGTDNEPTAEHPLRSTHWWCALSIKVMTAVFDHGPAAPSDRLMLLALADHADDSGVAWPGVERLAHKCCVHRDTARRTLRRLEDEGWITTVTGGGTINGEVGRTSRYQIVMERLAEQPGPTPTSTRGSGSTTPTSTSGYPHVHVGPTPTSTRGEPSVEPSKNPKPVIPSGEVAESRTPIAPERHPSRSIDGWAPRREFIEDLRKQFPGVDVRARYEAMVDWKIAKGQTSRSWEAELRDWVRRQFEKQKAEESPLDDMGLHRAKVDHDAHAAKPGDPDYVDPEELHRLAEGLG